MVGRRPGIRGWLRERCPELMPHYKAVMAYKALADKVQMATGLQSKYSIVDVIDVIIEFGVFQTESKGRKRAAQGDSGTGKRMVAERMAAQADGERAKELAVPRKTLGELLRALRDAAASVPPENERRRVTARAKAAAQGALKNERRRVSLRPNSAPRVTLRALDDEVRFRLGLVRMRRLG